MKLVMTLLVRDGVEMIRENLNFHLERGVDHVVVIDNGSIDGTREILSIYEKNGVVTVFDEPIQDFSQSKWVTSAALYAKKQLGAEWVLNNDIDEFWWTAEGNLKTRLENNDNDMLIAQRRNMVFAYDDDVDIHWSKKLIYRVQKPVAVQRLQNIYEQPLEAIYFYMDLPPKVIVRTTKLKFIAMGNHTAEFEGTSSQADTDILIYHFPITSAEQFRQKIMQGGEAYLNNKQLSERVGWHWRRWHSKIVKTGLMSALTEALPSSERLRRDIEDGIVVEDRTMQEVFNYYN